MSRISTVGRGGKGENTHTGSKIGLMWFSKSETVETDWSRDGPRLKSDNLRRGCRLQDRGAVQGRSESRQHVVAHRRSGIEVRPRGVIRVHKAFLFYEMRAPAGTGRGGISISGGWQGYGAWKRSGVRGHHLLSPPCFLNIIYLCTSAFCLNKGGCDETSVLYNRMHEFLYMFHFNWFDLFAEKEWQNTPTHKYEDTRTKNKSKNKTKKVGKQNQQEKDKKG